MNVEHYEPLVRQLCQGIRDPHVRSEAEQEGRIRLWRFGHLVDKAAEPEHMANRLITVAKRDIFLGKAWTGVGKAWRRCEHGDQDRRTTDGNCRICDRARRRGGDGTKQVRCPHGDADRRPQDGRCRICRREAQQRRLAKKQIASA